MILLKWKVARYVVIGGVLVGFIWLAYWVVPTLGFFNLAASDSPFTENGVSMVFFKDGKASSAYSMNKVTFGWSLIKEAWPLVLLGVLLGCPFGEILRRQVAVEQLSESAKKKQMDRSIDLLKQELLVKGFLEEASELTIELPQLREKEKQLRKAIAIMKHDAEEQTRNYEILEQKFESQEKELFKARAKIRQQGKRLDAGKMVDDSHGLQ